MSTNTVDRPTVAVERASREHVAALMLKAVRDHGLPYPREVDFHNSTHLWVTWDDPAEMVRWFPLLDAAYDHGCPRPHPTLPIMMHFAHAHDWNGWDITLRADQAIAELAPVTAALIDEVTACTCGGEVVHQTGCPALVYDEPANADEWIPRCMVAPSCLHPQIENARRGGCVHHDEPEPLMSTDFPGKPFGRGDTITILTPEPVDLPDAPECPSCGVLGGSHQESCYAAPFRIYDNGKPWLSDVVKHLNAAFPDRYGNLPNSDKARIAAAVREARADRFEATRIAASMLAEPSRVDVEAAAQIPVVVVDLPRRIPGASFVHWLDPTETQWSVCGEKRASEQYTSMSGSVTCPDCAATLLPIPYLPVDPADVPIELVPTDDLPPEVAEAIAHRHETVPVVDILTVDPDLTDDGRGGAGVARMGGAS